MLTEGPKMNRNAVPLAKIIEGFHQSMGGLGSLSPTETLFRERSLDVF